MAGPKHQVTRSFQNNFKAFRKDRQDDLQKQIDSNEPEELKVDKSGCELVWSQVKINENINWEDENVKPYATIGKLCNQLLFTVKDSHLDQVVDQPTRITETTANILDLFFANNRTLINKLEVIPGISDHEAVFIKSSLRPMRVRILPRKINIYKKASYSDMEAELKALEDEFCSSETTSLRGRGTMDKIQDTFTLPHSKVHLIQDAPWKQATQALDQQTRKGTHPQKEHFVSMTEEV